MGGVKFTNISGDRADLTIYQGKSVSFNYIFGGSDPIDVTGFDASLVVRGDYASASAFVEFTVENDRVVIGDTNGNIAFSMTATDSAALLSNFSGVYEIEIVTAAGEVLRGLGGNFFVFPEVAK